MKSKRIKFGIPVMAIALLVGCAPVNSKKEENTPIEIAVHGAIKKAQGNIDEPFKLEATVGPSYAYNKKVNWTISWDSDDSSSTDDDKFKKDKVVTDYVKIAIEGDNNEIANVTLVEPFASQILITASADQNAKITGTATVNYIKKYTAEIVNSANTKEFIPRPGFWGDKYYNPVSETAKLSIGTKNPDVNKGKITYKYGKNFYVWASGYGGARVFDSTAKIHNYKGSESKLVVDAVAKRLGKVTTRTVDFEELASGFWVNEYDTNKSYLSTFYMALYDYNQTPGNIGNIYLPYTAYLDGVQVNAGVSGGTRVEEDGVSYELAKVNLEYISETLDLKLSLSDSNIDF